MALPCLEIEILDRVLKSLSLSLEKSFYSSFANYQRYKLHFRRHYVHKCFQPYYALDK